MSGSWYMEAGARQWHWNKEPTFVCPNAEVASMGEGRAIVRRETQVTQAATALAADPLKLAVLLSERHRSGGVVREKTNGRYTGRCRICGAKLIRRGFRGWVDDEIPKSKMTAEELRSARFAAQFGTAPPRRSVGEGRYFDTKQQAEQWARDGAKEAK